MTEGLISTGFDYGQLDHDIAAEIQDAAGRVRSATRAAVIEVGCELLRVKERLKHGQFKLWVKNDCQLAMRTAQRAMQVAEMIGKCANLAYLPPDGVVALADGSAPRAVVEGIIEEIEAGGRPSAADIRRRLRDAKRMSNASTAAHKSAALKPILRVWTKLQPADKETALIALWRTLPPAQRATFCRLVGAAQADGLPDDVTALSPDTEAAVTTDIAVDEPHHVEESPVAGSRLPTRQRGLRRLRRRCWRVHRPLTPVWQ